MLHYLLPYGGTKEEESVTEPIGIYKKVVELRRRIGAIAKDSQMTGGASYKFRGYEALFLSARPAMDELGICVEIAYQDNKNEVLTVTTAKGDKTQVFTHGVAHISLVDADDGSRVTYCAPYTAMDSSDKSAGKAASYAMKTALFTGLMIPTEDLPEQDAERPEAGKKAKAQEPVNINAEVVKVARAALAKCASATDLRNWRQGVTLLTTDEKALLAPDYLDKQAEYPE